MKREELLHPLTLRIWHWINTSLILLLIFTGVRLMISGLHPILDYRGAVLLHRAAGFAMAGSFLFWLSYSIATGSLGKYYLIRSRDLSGLLQQVKYYACGVFSGDVDPFPRTAVEKFNPLQKVAHLSIMFVFTPIIATSGILYSNIMLFRGVIVFIGGVRVLDAIHLAAAYIFVIYLLVHIYLSTMGRTPFSRVLEMFTGRQDDPEAGKGADRLSVSLS